MGSRVWLFGVKWRLRSRDHLTRGGRLPVGGSRWPCVYLAPLRRYGASNNGCTDLEKKTEEQKQEGEGEEEGEGKAKGEKKGEGGRKKCKTHGRTHRCTLGCTDARTLGWFYTLSNAMHCIGQTTTGINSAVILS